MKPRTVILLKIWAMAGGFAGLAEIAAAGATGSSSWGCAAFFTILITFIGCCFGTLFFSAWDN